MVGIHSRASVPLVMPSREVLRKISIISGGDSRRCLSKCKFPLRDLSSKRKTVVKKTSDVNGNELTFCEIKRHGASTARCDEYIVAKEAFNFRRWSFLTVTFFSLAFYSNFYNADVTILGVILVSLCCTLVLKMHRKVKQESLLVMASIGLQLTTTFVTGRKATKFIFHKDIFDVVINEGITMHRVLHYLAVLLKDTNGTALIVESLPLFQNTLPRLDCLEIVYRGLQTALYAQEP